MGALPPGGVVHDWAFSLEAEQALLGALLIDNSALARVSAALSPADFYIGAHAAIYRLCIEMRRRGELADLVTVTEAWRREDPEVFAADGGAAYLAQLAANAPSTLNVQRYAELVRDKAHCRRLDALCLDVSRLARASHGRDVGALIAEARAQIGGFAEQSGLSRALHADTGTDFIALELPELDVLLAPWLCQKNLCMVHAKRGVGKTHFALGLSFAVAGGASFLGWTAPKRRGVLYVDGEMPAQLMQRRLRELATGHGGMPDLLRVVTPDRQDEPMPDLATASGQAQLNDLIGDDTSLIVLDNLSCLVRSGGAENESESWTAVSEWALKHRRAGRAILFIHHSGKTGAQRGTSKREDLLDVVINLRRPPEHEEADGAVFTVYFEKARSLTGDDIAPIEARLQQIDGGGQAWTYRAGADVVDAHVIERWDGGGVSLTDVARELGMHKSTAHRKLEIAMKAGLLKRDYPATRRKKDA